MSWLEATPTIFDCNLAPIFISKSGLWERHLAAIKKHFEGARNKALGQKMKVLQVVREGPLEKLPVHLPGMLTVTASSHIGSWNPPGL